MKYKAKQGSIEAVQFTDKYKDRVYNWARDKKAGAYPAFDDDGSCVLGVPNEMGEETCRIGDYLIVVSEPTATSWGKLSVCKQDIFKQLYEPVQLRDGENMKYRKKPVVVEAVQWTGENIQEIEDFAGYSCLSQEIRQLGVNDAYYRVQIQTLKGDMTASVGDYIIKGVKGEYYPCKPDIFEQTYEPAE